MNACAAQGLTLLCAMSVTVCAYAETPADAVDPSQVQVFSGQSEDAETAPGMLLLSQELLTSDGNLDIGKAAANIPFKVTYPSFGPGHKVALRWEGPTAYTTPLQTTAAVSPLTFYVPKATAAAAFGSSAKVTYTVEIPGAPAFTSDPLNVGVTLDQLSAPMALLANGGRLDVGKAPLQVPFTVAFPSLAAGEKVTLTWEGSTVYKTAAQTTTSTAALTFNVPRELIAKDLGQSARITYTVEIAGTPVQTSQPLSLQVRFNLSPPPRFPLSTGVDYAKQLNTRYADVLNRCDDQMPAYHCSGVIVRGVADGNFDPWNPSSSAARLGAQSFSFVRADANMKQTFVASGYVLSTPSEAIKQNKPLHYLCVYPYNAGTSNMTPLGKGCNAAATTQPLPGDDLSTCAGKNATTVEAWLAYTKNNAQCSLSVQDPAQFMTLLGVRAASPANTAHNEFLIETWRQDMPAELPLQGFFYTAQNALSAARNFQTKFKARTGEWLPVLRLDLNQSAPFAYDHGDQSTLP
jgi:hypothetical protein